MESLKQITEWTEPGKGRSPRSEIHDEATRAHSVESARGKNGARVAFERDIDLAMKATAGDLQAFETLYRRHERSARTIAARILRDPALAEDAVSEVFARLLTHGWPVTPEKTPPSGRLNAYVELLARRQAMWMRYHARLVERYSVSDNGEDDNGMVRLHSRHVSPEVRLQRLEVRARVLTAVRQLTPRLRSAAYLRFACEMSLADIERRLGLKPGCGATYLNRARQQLRVALADVVDVPLPGRLGKRRMRYEHEAAP